MHMRFNFAVHVYGIVTFINIMFFCCIFLTKQAELIVILEINKLIEPLSIECEHKLCSIIVTLE